MKRGPYGPQKNPRGPYKWLPLPGETEEKRVKRRQQSYTKKYYHRDKEFHAEKNRKYLQSERGHKVNMVNSAKQRHRTKFGKNPDLTADNIEWPVNCPILGTPLYYGWKRSENIRSENTPSIDQIDPGKGYTKDNVAIISWRANAIKGFGTAEEHRLVADWMDKNIRW
jgi:hypothetical protein